MTAIIVLRQTLQTLLCLLLLCSVASASADSAMTWPASSATASLEGLDLAATTPPTAISEQLLIRKEAPDQPLAPSELLRVLSLPPEAWASGADPDARRSSFVPVTLWILGAVHNRSDAPVERWLVLEPWRLWDVHLFVIDAETGDLCAGCCRHRQP